MMNDNVDSGDLVADIKKILKEIDGRTGRKGAL